MFNLKLPTRKLNTDYQTAFGCESLEIYCLLLLAIFFDIRDNLSNGNIIYGHDAFAGELGHVIVVPDGRLCGCGRKGCLETYASATGLSKTAYEMVQKKMTSEQVAKAAFEGEKWALEAFDYTSKILGMALANAVAITSPRMIFLFGGLANAQDLIFDKTKNYMEENLLPIYKNKVQIVPSSLDGVDAAILGSSALIWKELN